jgi:hypothetical protein
MVVPITVLLAAQSSAPADGNGADLLALGAGIVGGLIGSVASLLGVYFSNRGQLKRDRDNDLRKLRDDRRQRLRSDYVVLLAAARAMADIPFPRMSSSKVLPVEQEDLQQLKRQLAKAAEGLAVARVRLLLEEGGPEALGALDQVEQKAREMTRWLNEATEEEVSFDDKDWPERLGQLVNGLVDRELELRSAVVELEGIARTQLQKLEKPIGDLKY